VFILQYSQNVAKLHEQRIFMLLHKFFHHSDKLPIVFRDYFTLNSVTVMVIVRGTVTVCMCLLCNQHLGNDHLNLKGSMFWNNLPASLREPMSINKIRKLIKLY